MTRADEQLPRGILPTLHAAYWFLYAVVIAVIFGIATVRSVQISFTAAASLFVICVVPEVVAFYFSYRILFARFLRPRRFTMLIVGAITTALGSTLMSFAIAFAVFGGRQNAFREPVEGASLAVSLFLLAGVHIATALVIRGFVAWFETASAAAELKRRNLEAELALVRAQLDPHFLFNTLNNIDVLIEKDPNSASRYLNGLAELLRFVVYEAPAETVALDREIEQIRRYIALQQLRSSDAARIAFDVSGDDFKRPIAPMLIFPFVENAFKHGSPKGRIHISIDLDAAAMRFACRNETSETTSTPGGRGDELVRRRLELLYPERHLLETVVDAGTYEVKLTIYDD